jgi:hypothetical protein
MEELLHRVDRSAVLRQSIPLVLTVVILGILLVILHATLFLFNQIPGTIPLLLIIRPQDVIIGATIYLKTEIDFALLLGRLMHIYPGWRNRVALEIGSALGNAGGTILIIAIWILFKHIDILLALMIIVASLVLFELAHSGLEYLSRWRFSLLHTVLDFIVKITNPLLSRLIPNIHADLTGKENLSWKKLAVFSIKMPFILGLDDFAGYVPLFSVVNVYGFAVGVFCAHTLLNIFLFLSPKRTISIVKNEYVSFIGILIFVGLAFYGLFEAGKIIVGMF